MGYIYFLIGGARSGKSSYAEELARQLSDKVTYIATAEIIDEEMQKLILQEAAVFELKKTAIRKGMLTMYQRGLIDVISGITTLEEIKRVIE